MMLAKMRHGKEVEEEIHAAMLVKKSGEAVEIGEVDFCECHVLC